jgi:hypothetical protein
VRDPVYTTKVGLEAALQLSVKSLQQTICLRVVSCGHLVLDTQGIAHAAPDFRQELYTAIRGDGGEGHQIRAIQPEKGA